MEVVRQTTCSNGHASSRLCMVTTCPLSPMCNESLCKHNFNHQKCITNVTTQHLMDLLLKKNEDIFINFEKDILGTYTKMIKQIEMQRSQYLSLEKTEGIRLEGEERELYELLKDGNGQQIKPSLVHKVYFDLTNTQKQVTSKLSSKLKQVSEQITTAQMKELEKMKQFWSVYKVTQIRQSRLTLDSDQRQRDSENSQVISQGCYSIFKFQEDFYESGDIKTSNHQTNIKRVKNDNHQLYSLISPSVTEQNNVVYLRVKEMKTYHCLGVIRNYSHRNSISRSSNAYRLSQNQISYLFFSHPKFNSNKKSQNRPKKTAFKFGPGDILQLQYLKNDRKLRVNNLMNNTSEEIRNLPQFGHDSHCFCVSTNEIEDQWEIVNKAESKRQSKELEQ